MVGFQDSFELQQGFVIEDHRIQIVYGGTCCLDAITNGPGGERRIVFDPGESLFLGGSYHPAVQYDGGGRIMKESRYAEDQHNLKKPPRFPEVALRIYSSVSGAEFKSPQTLTNRTSDPTPTP